MDEKPVPTDCVSPADKLCGYIEKEGYITRECMQEQKQGEDAKCFKVAESNIICQCNTDNCNHKCDAKNCKNITMNSIVLEECDAQCNPPSEGPSKNDTKPTEDSAVVTTEEGPIPTEDSSGNNGTDDLQPTEDITEATDDDGPQSTEDNSRATAEKAEETQKPTGKVATNSGNQRVFESNQFVFGIWILVTLVIRSFY